MSIEEKKLKASWLVPELTLLALTQGTKGAPPLDTGDGTDLGAS